MVLISYFMPSDKKINYRIYKYKIILKIFDFNIKFVFIILNSDEKPTYFLINPRFKYNVKY